MKHSLRIVLAAGLFALTGAAMAAGVKNLHGEYSNGQVTVTWTAPANQQVSFYNLYYSQSTIIGNNGEYDDFEKIAGGKTEFTMTRAPKGELYIAVLPVDAAGEETAPFTDELRLALTDGSVADIGTNVPADTTSSFLALEKAQSDSATGILLTFSHPVTVPATQAKTAFTVEDASGALMPLVRLTIRDTTALLHTNSQYRGTTYIVRVQPSVTGRDATDKLLNLDPLRSSVTFTATEGTPAPIGVPPAASSAPAGTLPATTVPQPVPPRPIPAKNGLPSSGAGIVAVLAASGAIVGWRRMRRKV